MGELHGYYSNKTTGEFRLLSKPKWVFPQNMDLFNSLIKGSVENKIILYFDIHWYFKIS